MIGVVARDTTCLLGAVTALVTAGSGFAYHHRPTPTTHRVLTCLTLAVAVTAVSAGIGRCRFTHHIITLEQRPHPPEPPSLPVSPAATPGPGPI